MNLDMFLGNILSPPVLFFFLGLFAVWVKSDLDIPEPLPKLFSLFLLVDIGFHGGHELSVSGFSLQMGVVILTCIIMACLIPIYSFFILRHRLPMPDAVAVAACFGSISAVTFITGVNFLRNLNIGFDGYMVAGMALMESPAILIGLLMFQLIRKRTKAAEEPVTMPWRPILQEAIFSGSVLLLVGALIIGVVSGEPGWQDFGPFYGIFKGVLALYLLEAGITAGSKIMSVLKTGGAFIVGFSILTPLFNAGIAILLSKLVLGISQGNALLFTLLCASASYIAVPVAMRLSLPQANPAYMIPVTLGLVFPFNVTIGIPLYYFVISHTW